MYDLRKCITVGVVLFIGLFQLTEPLFAADTPGLHGKVDPTVVRKVEWELRTFAKKLTQDGAPDKETIFAMLANYLWKNPEIYGAAFAFAPEKKNGREIKSSPYVYRSGDKLIQKDLIDSYDYTTPDQKWYTVPVKLGRPVWSEPYYDKGGGEAWMTTYSVPVFSPGKDHRLIGVVTSDVLIPWE